MPKKQFSRFLPAMLPLYTYVANVRRVAPAGSDAKTCFGMVPESCCIRNARTSHQPETFDVDGSLREGAKTPHISRRYWL
ncbi:unnamed protein product [Onchocerca ochengi]|uniref:Secreted protein n=1 Tax=Onchocerca ochengi TaxID=42157 RepID=A0A182EJM3_ONCOC|nr:unnamed protein product [Onchocerca ochengi]